MILQLKQLVNNVLKTHLYLPPLSVPEFRPWSGGRPFIELMRARSIRSGLGWVGFLWHSSGFSSLHLGYVVFRYILKCIRIRYLLIVSSWLASVVNGLSMIIVSWLVIGGRNLARSSSNMAGGKCRKLDKSARA